MQSQLRGGDDGLATKRVMAETTEQNARDAGNVGAGNIGQELKNRAGESKSPYVSRGICPNSWVQYAEAASITRASWRTSYLLKNI